MTAGEVFGILGPSGAGKTTALRMLSGIIVPSSGTARVAGNTPGENDIGLLALAVQLFQRETILTRWK